MKIIIGIALSLILTTNFFAQVSVTTDLPPEVLKDKEILVNVKFNKGPIKNYSKYEMVVPSGITIKEVDCKYGAFTFENNKVRIIWAITPAEPVFTIKLNLLTGNELGEKKITQTYAYSEKGQKLELEMANINFTISETVSNAVAENTGSAVDSALSNSNQTLVADEPIKSNVAINEPKSDPKEAEEIGNKEKLDAEAKLEEAKAAMRKAETISNANERAAAIEIANESKRKAEADLATANRILALSNSINESTKESEKLNQPIDSIVKVDNSQIAATTIENSTEHSNTTPGVKIEKARENAINKGASEAKDLYKDIKPEEHHDDKEIEQQVSQLRLDSKDALAVGTREKLKAEQSLHDAYDQLKKAKYMPETEEKKVAIAQANEAIETAKGDLEIASKILTLSKSLEENAKEIERLHLNDNASLANKEQAGISNSNNVVSKTEPIANNSPSSTGTKPINQEKVATSGSADNKGANPLVDNTSENSKQSSATENQEPATTGSDESKSNSIRVATVKKTHVKSNDSTVQIVDLSGAGTNANREEQNINSGANNENKNTNKETEKAVEKAEIVSAENTATKPVETSKVVPTETKDEKPIIKPIVKRAEPDKESKSNSYQFTLQLGSFINEPDMSKFKKLGKVEMKNIDGKYKVFYGKYTSKQEASEMRQKTVSKGFDCFVVSLN